MIEEKIVIMKCCAVLNIVASFLLWYRGSYVVAKFAGCLAILSLLVIIGLVGL